MSTEATGNTIISIDDLPNHVKHLQTQKEMNDKRAFLPIVQPMVQVIRKTAADWFMKGYPAEYPLIIINIGSLTTCSDGVERNLTDYFEFCMSRTLSDCVTELQSRLPGMTLSTVVNDTSIKVTVSRSL
jgi:hypothetical protein